MTVPGKLARPRNRRRAQAFAAVLAAALSSCAGPGAGPGARPCPLSPEMTLLEKDTRSEEYRKLLRGESKNVNVLNAEWFRAGVPDGPAGFAAAHGGTAKVLADPALRRAYEERKEIEDRFLAILREEFAFRRFSIPRDDGPKEEGQPAAGAGGNVPPAVAAALPTAAGTTGAAAAVAIQIEPILPGPGAESQWPRWRGPSGMGTSSERGLPLRWSAAENVAWKTELPGAGNSSPVIWGERIFLTTAFDQGKRRSLVSLRRAGGEILFVKDAPAAPPEGEVRDKNGYASATPATDGERVVCFFGNGGLAAFDLEGNLLWHHPLGPFEAMHGTGSSPVLCGDLAVLFQEQSRKPSIGIAVDKRTGEKRWSFERKPALGWSTPLPLRIGGRDLLVWGASNRLVAYDAASGAEVWQCAGPTLEVIPTVVAGHGLLFSASGRVGPTLAIRPAGAGDVSATAIAWRAPRGAPHVPSPVLWEDLLFEVSDLGIVTCLRAKTGEVLYQKRIGGAFSASPVAADGRIYLTSEEGDTSVLRAGPEFEVLAVNHLGETTLASPAVLGGRIYIRTQSHLFAIGGK
jgi:outer membrane protein assembly factor BamB